MDYELFHRLISEYKHRLIANKYEILAGIGYGNFGVVFLGYETLRNRFVAIKRYMVNRADLPSAIAEIEGMEVLSGNPYIIQCLGYETEESSGETPQQKAERLRFYIVMEYGGVSLEDYLKRYGAEVYREQTSDAFWRRNEMLSMHFIKDILAGLRDAHEQHIVHRDIKPANIYIDRDITTRIGDFGVAKQLFSEGMDTGTIVGTAFYMAPEQMEGDKYGTNVDLFAAGILFYRMLSGRMPFLSLVQIHTKDPDLEVPGIFDGMRPILAKLLQKDPAKRYQTAQEMLLDLEDYEATLEPVGMAEVLAECRRQWETLVSPEILDYLNKPPLGGTGKAAGEGTPEREKPVEPPKPPPIPDLDRTVDTSKIPLAETGEETPKPPPPPEQPPVPETPPAPKPPKPEPTPEPPPLPETPPAPEPPKPEPTPEPPPVPETPPTPEPPPAYQPPPPLTPSHEAKPKPPPLPKVGEKPLPAPKDARGKKGPSPALWIALIVAVVAVAAVLAYFLLSPSHKEIKIWCDQAAEVFIDGEYAGTISKGEPFVKRVNADTEHKIVLKLEGFKDTERILLPEREILDVTMKPVARPPVLEVSLDQRGAMIYMDGRKLTGRAEERDGRFVWTFHDLEAGSFALAASLPESVFEDVTSRVDLKHGETTQISLDFTQRKSARLFFAPTDAAGTPLKNFSVEVDGVRLQVGEDGLLDGEFGMGETYTLSLKAAGYKPWNQDVEITGEDLRFEPKLAKAPAPTVSPGPAKPGKPSIAITSNINGWAFVNWKECGRTPIRCEIPDGKIEILVVNYKRKKGWMITFAKGKVPPRVKAHLVPCMRDAILDWKPAWAYVSMWDHKGAKVDIPLSSLEEKPQTPKRVPNLSCGLYKVLFSNKEAGIYDVKWGWVLPRSESQVRIGNFE